MSKFAKLQLKWTAKIIAMSDVERAVAESVICTGEGYDAAFLRGQHRRFKRGFDGFETELER